MSCARPLHPLFAAELGRDRPRRRHRCSGRRTRSRAPWTNTRSRCCPISISTMKNSRPSPASMARSKWRRRRTARRAVRPPRPASRTATSSTSPTSTSAARSCSLDDQRRAYRDGNQLWHTDSSFRQKSATWSMLHARVIPPDGADTEFADTRAAYDALPAATKTRLEGLIAEHSIWHSRAQARRLHADRGGKEIAAAGAASGGAAASRLRAQRALHRLARLAHHRLAGRGRPRAAAKNCSPSRRSRALSTGTNGGSAIWSSGTTAAPCTARRRSNPARMSATCAAAP